MQVDFRLQKRNVLKDKIVLMVCVTLLIISIGCNDHELTKNDITYNTHIRPILSDKCFKCHSPDANKRKSGYRLDTEEGAFAALKDFKDKSGIVAGHPEKSDVFLRITYTDPDYMMPPPESNLSLTKDEITLIEKWIKNGAPYQKHWSFIPLKATPIPDVKSTWANNEIDRFIAQKLQENDLQPSEVMYDAALLKRMMHDVTGLPPTLAQQDEFGKTPDAKTYEKLLDKALASPQYGEKMAIFWMDVGRYADSHGYQDDGLRTMWPWRDWVIHAFNKNYDYKKFVTWQLGYQFVFIIPTKS